MESISIFLGGAVAHSAVFTSFLHGQVVSETERALCILPDGSRNETFWLPKKALVHKKLPCAATGHHEEEYLISLARWFRPDSYQASIMQKYQRTSGVDAS